MVKGVVEGQFIDKGGEKNGLLDWVNLEVVGNLMSGIIEETELYTNISKDGL